ncbi:MAG: septum formation protein Maf [Bacteroidia bacterium]|nr:septum formation protein Maf [Bacteroidia bacterium]
MLIDRLKNYNIILASSSPRRQEIFSELGIEFEIRLKPVKEEYPDRLNYAEISDYLAQLKSLPFEEELKPNDILITSDTIVWHENEAIGKPKDEAEAFQMIQSLSGKTHEVISSVCIKSRDFQKTVNALTKVSFREIEDEEIWYYIKNYDVLDKAGAYGIQDWIGKTAVTSIEGSYFNVMGLPMHLVYKTLNELVNR